MLEGNLAALEPRSATRAPTSSDYGDDCQFRPEAYLADGVHVQRERVLAGKHKSSSLPLLVVAANDGPAVKVTKQRSGGMQSRVFVTGDVEIYPTGVSHGGATLDRSTDQLYLGIEPHVISNTAEAAGIDSHRVDIVEHFGSQDPTVHHAACRLFREQQTSGLGSRLYTQAVVTELVIHLLREYSSLRMREDGSPHSVGRGKLRPALEMIHDDLQANLSLNALADAVQLSPYHFSRVFKRVTGQSPHQYVLRQRVELARQLLMETSLSIADVAQRAGFYDQSHFTHHFKRLVGIAPGAVRERKNFLPA